MPVPPLSGPVSYPDLAGAPRCRPPASPNSAPASRSAGSVNRPTWWPPPSSPITGVLVDHRATLDISGGKVML